MGGRAESPRTPESENAAVRQLLLTLHDAHELSPYLLDRAQIFATLASRAICSDYETLNATVTRHEALIRKRWMKKTPAQRRIVLLDAWSGMPEQHRPDDWYRSKEQNKQLTDSDNASHEEDARCWPFINQEDLVKPKSLLIFLNARGRNLPWTFILSEREFSGYGRVLSHSEKVAALSMHFSPDLNPTTYGKVGPPCSLGSTRGNSRSDTIHCRLVQGLQCMLLQKRILRFLVDCSRALLHDIDPVDLTTGPVQEEPPMTELSIDIDIANLKFSEFTVIEPYRNRNTLDVERLSQHIEAAYNVAKDHVWALREDPSYMSDTIMDISDHKPEQVLDPRNGKPHPLLDTPMHLSEVLKDVVIESYTMLYMWHELHERMQAVLKISRTAASDSVHFRAVIKLRDIAREFSTVLISTTGRYMRGWPTMRKTDRWVRFDMHTRLCCERCMRSLGEGMVVGEMISRFQRKPYGTAYPRMMHHTMDLLDYFTRTDDHAMEVMTSPMSALFTQMSVVSECVFQIELWTSSPHIAPLLHEDPLEALCGCSGGSEHEKDEETEEDNILSKISRDRDLESFRYWVGAIGPYQLAPQCVQLFNPARGKLKYPSHKARTARTVKVMRDSEDQLDNFWALIDRTFAFLTGVAQHDVIRRCLLQGGQMQRTAPWVVTPDPNLRTPEYEYVPFFEQAHDASQQITGCFDKLSMIEKLKLKTKGAIVETTYASTKADEPTSQKPSPSYPVDKRTFKVFETLFHISASDLGEQGRSVKWGDFRRAMVRMGFSAEKLQGSAWQFTPGKSIEAKYSIQFHEPHPVSDIPHAIAKRFGRRLTRVYGWRAETFRLA